LLFAWLIFVSDMNTFSGTLIVFVISWLFWGTLMLKRLGHMAYDRTGVSVSGAFASCSKQQISDGRLALYMAIGVLLAVAGVAATSLTIEALTAGHIHIPAALAVSADQLGVDDGDRLGWWSGNRLGTVCRGRLISGSGVLLWGGSGGQLGWGDSARRRWGGHNGLGRGGIDQFGSDSNDRLGSGGGGELGGGCRLGSGGSDRLGRGIIGCHSGGQLGYNDREQLGWTSRSSDRLGSGDDDKRLGCGGGNGLGCGHDGRLKVDGRERLSEGRLGYGVDNSGFESDGAARKGSGSALLTRMIFDKDNPADP
jgi:hypothetical protein